MLSQYPNQKKLREERLSKALHVLTLLDLDALLVTTWDNVRYITGARTVISPEWSSLLTAVLTRDGDVGLFGPFREGREEQESLEKLGDWTIFPIGENSAIPEKWARTYSKLLKHFGKSRGKIGVDFMGFQIFQQLQRDLPGCEFVDSFRALLDERAVKTPEEIKALSNSARIVDEGMNAALNNLSAGRRENEVYAKAASKMIEMGSEGEPFYQMLSSGDRSTDHIFPSTKQIIPGEPVLIDMGCFVDGYAGDLARTGCYGPIDKKFRDLYSSFYEGYVDGIKLVAAGKKTSTIDREIRRILRESECPANPTSLGHGIGMRCIEFPSFNLVDEPNEIETNDSDILKPGMVITIEPKVTVQGIGTIGLEDMILIQEGGTKKLTGSPYLTP
ncbi:MAG: Xaa-Pro peptidase family protein [Thaumarchaeota archaeon]|nr:Xaa-Pro peptidase family protein [Nitrososphaerota archaeon]